jgi:hypothetical protein
MAWGGVRFGAVWCGLQGVVRCDDARAGSARGDDAAMGRRWSLDKCEQIGEAVVFGRLHQSDPAQSKFYAQLKHTIVSFDQFRTIAHLTSPHIKGC